MAAPVGLDIGSQSVAEIAISIVAELIARRNLGPQGLARPCLVVSPGQASRAGSAVADRREPNMIAALVPAAGRSAAWAGPSC